jgi:hypothetical protein
VISVLNLFNVAEMHLLPLGASLSRNCALPNDLSASTSCTSIDTRILLTLDQKIVNFLIGRNLRIGSSVGVLPRNDPKKCRAVSFLTREGLFYLGIVCALSCVCSCVFHFDLEVI